MGGSARHWIAIGALALAIGVSAPARAEAQGTVEIALTSAVVAGAALGVGFTVADTISFAMNSPWDDGWAGVEIGVASAFLITWAALSIAALDVGLRNDAYGMWQTYLGYSVAPGVIGGYILSHAIWSLSENDRPPPATLTVAPTAEGAIASVAGAF